MHKCTQSNCDKEYNSKKALDYHVRECHGSDESKICNNCGVTFSSRASMNRHRQNCFTETKFVPQTSVNTTQSEQHRHLHISVKLNETGTQILDEFRDWMKNGGYSSLLKHCKRKLTDKSISTYALHLRSLLCFIIEAKKPREDIILAATQLPTYKEFILFLEKSNYCAKTIANKIFAMERLIGFLYEELENLKKKSLTCVTLTHNTKGKLSEIMDFLKSEASAISPAANRETLVRNCRQTLESEGKWESLPVMLEKFVGLFL
jgi:hypothetical protein